MRTYEQISLAHRESEFQAVRGLLTVTITLPADVQTDPRFIAFKAFFDEIWERSLAEANNQPANFGGISM